MKNIIAAYTNLANSFNPKNKATTPMPISMVAEGFESGVELEMTFTDATPEQAKAYASNLAKLAKLEFSIISHYRDGDNVIASIIYEKGDTSKVSDRVITRTNKKTGTVSNPEQVRIMLKEMLATYTPEQIVGDKILATKIATEVGITVPRANVLIKDNVNKVAESL